MRALELVSPGWNGLRLTERPSPPLGPRQVRVALRAASLNYRDVAVVRDGYGGFALPLVLGSDGAGVVVERAPDATRLALGTRVVLSYVPRWIDGPPDPERTRERLGGPLDGVLRDEIVIDEAALVAIPPSLSDEDAACLPIAGVTAWRALFAEGAPIGAGDVVVVQGSGGVSSAARRLAEAAGARVIVVSRRREVLVKQGVRAEDAIDTTREPEWSEAVRARTGGRGADRVIDVAGGAGLARSVRAVRMGGDVVVVGFVESTLAELDLRAAILRQVTLRAISGGSRAHLEEVVAAGLRSSIDEVVPLERAADAIARLATGTHAGKIVVRIG